MYSLDEFFSKPTAVIDVIRTFRNDFLFLTKDFYLDGRVFS